MKNIYDPKKYFSPWVIICRGNKLNLDRDLNNIFHSFVNNYLNIYKSNPFNQFLNAKEIKINQIKYDKYSFEKDPADKLFKSLSRFNLFPLHIITHGEKYFLESYKFFILLLSKAEYFFLIKPKLEQYFSRYLPS